LANPEQRRPAPSNDVWVIAEHKHGQFEDVSLELVSGARQLADELGEEVGAVIIGSADETLAGALASYGADRVYLVDSPSLSGYSVEHYVAVLAGLFEEEKPGIVLCGATFMGRDIAPRLAARLKTGLVSECTALAINEERLLQPTKLIYDGKVSATFLCPASSPQMATVKAGAMAAKKLTAARKPEVRVIAPEAGKSEPRCKVLGVRKADPDSIGLDEAEVIVAGGRGLGSAANFQLLNGLARNLGGVVAASLGAIDEGWARRKSLIGQTGMSVTPRLYVACGISGSIYHVMGMKDSRFIVAINKDRNAPIFSYADMGIVGDAADVIPAITGRLEALSKSTAQQSKEAKDD
jgi:electron transfer flavoprotein alpha subunit